MKKLLILLTTVLLVGCNSNDISTDVSAIVPPSNDVVEENVAVNEDVVEHNAKSTNSDGIYEMCPVGMMVGETLGQVKEKYDLLTSETQEDGFTKHIIKFTDEEITVDSMVNEEVITIVTNDKDVVTLVLYSYMGSLTGDVDSNLKISVDNMENIYNLLADQGEELPLVYTELDIKESGIIPQLVLDYNDDKSLDGGNYESRFNLDGIEVEAGVFHMLNPDNKEEGIYLRTITFEPFVQS